MTCRDAIMRAVADVDRNPSCELKRGKVSFSSNPSLYE